MPPSTRPAGPGRRRDPAPRRAGGAASRRPTRRPCARPTKRSRSGPSRSRRCSTRWTRPRSSRTSRWVRGDVDAAMAAADLVVEGTYRVGHQEQLYIENQAMIAVPRDDGGVTVHGSLQCPYYVHKALKRARAQRRQAVVVQTETGGGFGGKEEYPSMIAIHAALLARKAGSPVDDLRAPRGHRGDHQAPPGGDPLSHRRHARRDARGPGRRGGDGWRRVLHAHAGGALARHDPRWRAVPVPNVRILGRATATNTPPNGAFRGFGAPQTEFAAEMQRTGRGGAGHVAARSGAAGSTSWETSRRRARCCAKARGGRRGPRAAGGGDRVRTGARADRRASGGRPARGRLGARHRPRPGLARRRLHGQRRGPARERGDVDAVADGRTVIRIASTEMGQGTKTIFPQLVAAELGVAEDDVDIAPVDTSGPRHRAHGRVPDRDGRRGPAGPGGARRPGAGGGARRLPFRCWRRGRDDARPGADRRAVRALPGVHFDDGPTRATRTRPWLGRPVAEVDVDLDTGEVAVRDVVAATTSAGSSTRCWRRARSRAARSRRWATRRSRR